MVNAAAVPRVAALSSRELRLLRRAAFAGDTAAIGRARRQFPDSKEVLKYSGILHYRRKELATAEDELSRAVAARPDAAESANFLMRGQYNDESYDQFDVSA